MLRIYTHSLISLAVLCSYVTPQLAHAQGLPKAEDVIEQYIEATGGKAAYEKLKNRVAKGTMEITGLNLKGTVTIYAAPPNKMYVEAELPGFGKIEDGTDGKVAWSNNPTSGPRIKEDAEKEAALRNADFNSELNWRKHYKKVECVGTDTIEGKPCYKVELTTTDNQLETDYYDKASHLLVKKASTQKGPTGDIAVESFADDYKKVDGVLMPFKTRQKVLAQEIVVNLDKIEHNVNLPANRFDLPEDVKKLVEKDKK